MCGAYARTAAEWDAHRQQQATAAAGPVEIVRIGDAPPRPLPKGPRPPSAVRMLDLTRILDTWRRWACSPRSGAARARVGAGRCAFRSPRLADGCGILPRRVTFQRPLTCQFRRGTSSKATPPSGVCGIWVLRSRCPPRRRTGPCPQTRLDSIRPYGLVNPSRPRPSCH